MGNSYLAPLGGVVATPRDTLRVIQTQQNAYTSQRYPWGVQCQKMKKSYRTNFEKMAAEVQKPVFFEKKWLFFGLEGQDLGP